MIQSFPARYSVCPAVAGSRSCTRMCDDSDGPSRFRSSISRDVGIRGTSFWNVFDLLFLSALSLSPIPGCSQPSLLQSPPSLAVACSRSCTRMCDNSDSPSCRRALMAGKGGACRTGTRRSTPASGPEGVWGVWARATLDQGVCSPNSQGARDVWEGLPNTLAFGKVHWAAAGPCVWGGSFPPFPRRHRPGGTGRLTRSSPRGGHAAGCVRGGHAARGRGSIVTAGP